MKRTAGPLSRLLDFDEQASSELLLAPSGTSQAETVLRQLGERESILNRIGRQGLLGRCFVEVYVALTALRNLRGASVTEVTPSLRSIHEIHHALNGIPGIPCEPRPDSIRTVDDEIAHLDAVLKALNELLAQQAGELPELAAVPEEGLDGGISLRQFSDLCGLSVSTLAKRPDKPLPIVASTGSRPARYSYQELRGWLPDATATGS